MSEIIPKAPAFREFCKPYNLPAADHLRFVDKRKGRLRRCVSVFFRETAIHFRTTFQNLRIELGYALFHQLESAKANLPERAIRWAAFRRKPLCSTLAFVLACSYFVYCRFVFWQLTRHYRRPRHAAGQDIQAEYKTGAKL